MREQFEEWAKSLDFDLTRHRNENGYVYQETEAAWLAWQASRKAMPKIKLPEYADIVVFGPANYARQQCAEAIKQAGYEVEE